MHRTHSMLIAGILTASCAFAQMQPVVTDNQGAGGIDWANRVIVATGIGVANPDMSEAAARPGAMRAAQQIALRNALEAFKGIMLNSTTTVENFMVKSDLITSKVGGFIKGFKQEGRTKYMSDGSVEITMSIPLDGIDGAGNILYGSEIGTKPSITAFEGGRTSSPRLFSGLVVDCRGLRIKPALCPRIIDEAGKEVYGSAYVSREWAIKQGIVGYAKSLDDAKKLDRIGKTPGSIKAVKAAGENAIDVTISDVDAADIRSAAKNLSFLSECRIVFVVD